MYVHINNIDPLFICNLHRLWDFTLYISSECMCFCFRDSFSFTQFQFCILAVTVRENEGEN